MTSRRRYIGVAGATLLLAIAASGSSQAQDGERILVFAAASMTSAVGEIVDLCGRQQPDPIGASFAASSVLARQIEQGASADLYISANTDWMDYLDGRDLLADGSRRRFAGNSLVVIAPSTAPAGESRSPLVALADLPAEDRIAMGDPDYTPAGEYAKAALQSYGIWEGLRGQVAGAPTVRAALALVETGSAPLGIVYETDARISQRVRVVAAFPAHSHPPIVYEIALVDGRDTVAVRQFLDCALGDDAAAILERHGFLSAPGIGHDDAG